MFGVALAVVAALFFSATVSPELLFWTVFMPTRLLGATVGDFVGKSEANGGLSLGRFAASVVLVALILACSLLIPRRAWGASRLAESCGVTWIQAQTRRRLDEKCIRPASP